MRTMKTVLVEYNIITKRGINPQYTRLLTKHGLLSDIIEHTKQLPEDATIRERLYWIINDIGTIPTCCAPECDTPVTFQSSGIHRNTYAKYCSLACSNSSNEVQYKKMQTTLQNYNVDNPSQSLQIKDKKLKTSRTKYGVDYPWQSDVIKQRTTENMLSKYGVTNISKLHFTEFTKQCLESEDWLTEQHHGNHRTLSNIAQELNVDSAVIIRALKQFNITQKYWKTITTTGTSKAEQEIIDWLSSLDGITVIRNSKPIYPFELDVYLPEYNLAIEYNGLYWHSDVHERMDIHYHLRKTQLCEEQGIRLIHIFEDEWRDQQQKCKDTIQHLLGKSPRGVYARKCEVKEIPWNIAKDFLNRYHLLGAGSSGNYRIGAYYNNELIGVMVFGQSSSEGTKEVELKRFVTNKKNNPGLGSKMFKYAAKSKEYQEVVAFVDRRWFTGLVKSYIGFEKVDETKPALWWTDGKQRKHRRFTDKQKLISIGADPSLSKRKMLESIGYYRIWDCGKIKLKWVQ